MLSKKLCLLGIISSLFLVSCENTEQIEETPLPSFTLEGTEIYQGDTLLVQNLEYVSSIFQGPDGYTIHLEIEEGAPPSNNVTCIYLGDKEEVPPFDYKSITNYGLLSCDNGYIENSNYFAYLEVSDQNLWTLHVRGETNEIHYEMEVDEEFFSSEDILRNLDPVEGSNGLTYYYPERSAYLSGEKLAMTFGAMMIAVDLTKEEIWDYETLPFNDFFFFRSQANLPFIVETFATEGPATYQSVYDFSGSEIKKYSLKDLNLPAGTSLLEWQEDRLIIHAYQKVDIGDQVAPEYMTILENSQDPEEVKSTLLKINEELMSTGLYVDTYCESRMSGYPAHCFAFLEGQDYFIEPGGEIQPLD